MADPREAAAAPGAAAARAEAAARLARLGEEFFEVVHSTDPFNATQLGVPGFDALVPDPSRAGAARGAERIAAIERRLGDIDAGLLGESGRTDHAVLAHLAWGARADLEHGLWEANASAAGYVSPQAMVFQSVPAAAVGDAAAVGGYLRRLRGLSGYFDAVTGRYREASRDGRLPTQAGVRQAAAQLAGHLGKDIGADTLVAVRLPDGVDQAAIRREAARIVADEVRPAMRRLLACLQEELLPAARPDDKAGIRFVPGGAEGYLAAVRRHTTTGLSPADRLGADADRAARLPALPRRRGLRLRRRLGPVLRAAGGRDGPVHLGSAAAGHAVLRLAARLPPRR